MKYKFENIRGKKFCIKCNTDKEWTDVLDIISEIDKEYISGDGYVPIRGDYMYLITNLEEGIDSAQKEWGITNKNYVKISAEDFIRDNTEEICIDNYSIFN